MKKLNPFLTLCLTALSVSTLWAQIEKPKTYSSLDGEYSVKIHPSFRAGGGGPLEDSFKHGLGNSYSTYWNSPDRTRIQAGFVLFNDEKGRPSSSEKRELLDEASARTKTFQAEEGGGTLIHEKKITINRIPVTELYYRGETRDAIFRLYLTSVAIVRLSVIFERNVGRVEAMSFLDSLEAPSRDKIIEQKIADATPSPPPPCSSDSAFVSDTKLHDLLGNVSSIVEEREEVEDGVSERFVLARYSFDRAGRLLKSLVYESGGRPDSISVYGCLDGMRVVKNGSVQYENRFSAYGPLRPGAKPRDTRYSTSYTATVDLQGRVTTRTRIGNDSLVWSITDTTYAPDRIEEITKNIDGDISNKNVTEIDQKGKPIKKVNEQYGSDGTVWKNTYSNFTFDTSGNWIKRLGIYERIVKGKVERTADYTQHRTITYHKKLRG